MTNITIAIILAVIYGALAGVCLKNYREEAEDNCLFGFWVFTIISVVLIIKFVF